MEAKKKRKRMLSLDEKIIQKIRAVHNCHPRDAVRIYQNKKLDWQNKLNAFNNGREKTIQPMV